MRSIPVDLSRVQFIGTGKFVEKPEYVELSDGSRKRSGNQAKDDAGTPLWTVDVIVDDEDAMRAEAIGVTVASYDEPVTPKWQPVKFREVTATIYMRDGRPAVSLRAEGIEKPAQVKVA
jgi:hypothetical protein